MTNPTHNSLGQQGVPNNSDRCLGSGSYEDGKWHWREGCDDCQRRLGWGPGWIDPPPIIAFECEYRIAPDKIVAQREHAPGPEPLSTSAQAVLDAATVPTGSFCLENVNEIAAAALRALADQVVPVWKTPPSGEYELEYGQWIANNRIRRDMLAIATELEGQ